MYKLITYSDELYHYGVLGMRWGVRRYQNYDGTRIGTGGAPVVNKAKAARNTISGGQGGKAKGLARLAATANVQSENDSSEDSSEDKKRSTGEALFGPSVKNGKGKEDSSVAQKATKHLLEVDRSSKEIVKTFKDIDPKVKEAKESQEKKLTNKAKKMSDKELRDSINRIKMEREYVSLTTKETKTGYDKVVDVLDKAEPFLRVAGEVAGLLYLLYKFKNLKQFDDEDASDSIYSYCETNGIDGEILKHALDFDADYIIEYYGLSDDDVRHMLEREDELYHHGVKGMKWGVRRYQNYDGTRIGTGSGSGGGGGGSTSSGSFRNPKRAEMNEALRQKTKQHKDLAKAVGDWATRPLDERIEDHKKTIQDVKELGESIKEKVSNAHVEATPATKEQDNHQKELLESLSYYNEAANNADADSYKKYEKKVNKQIEAYFKKYGDDSISKMDNHVLDDGRNVSEIQFKEDNYKYLVIDDLMLKVAASAGGVKKSKVRADGKDESKFTREEKKISNDARKDAEEFARAKAFYGEGAGNRRKAIKTTVEAKKKKSKFYDEEFEYHLSQQDMEYHMREAKRERNSKDMTNNTRKALNKTNRALGQLSRYL